MAGVPNEAYVSPAAKTVFRAEAYKDEKQKMPELYGRRKDGSYEQIEFEEENNITTKYGLSCMQQVGNFVLLRYQKGHIGEVMSFFSSRYYSSSFSFEGYDLLLDKRSGKLFDITDYYFDSFVFGRCGIADNTLYCLEFDRTEPERNGAPYLCRISINENELKLERMIDTKLLGAFRLFVLDKYGNIYSTDDYQNGLRECYVYKQTTGTIEKFNKSFAIAANGIAYLQKQTIDDETGETVSSWGEWINSEGEAEEAEFIPDKMATNDIYYECSNFDYRVFFAHGQGFDIGLDNYERYLFREDDFYYCLDRYCERCPEEIMKYEFLDDVRYEVEFIDLEKCERYNGGDNTVYAGERVYFLNSEEVYYINMKDGSAHTLSSGYIFKKIYSDNQGGVIFEGLDERMNTVTGMIGADDTVTVGITPREYEIFYIASLN
ncbi:MAG: hypothetical protein ACI4ST_01460 [Candidatus Gallimonas sp.]